MSNSISRVLCHLSNNFNNTCYVVGAVALKERGRYVRSYHIKGSVSSRLVCSFCIQKGNMGCDQWFTVSWHCSCRTYFCCFPFALSNIRPRPLVPFFQICLINSQLKTTYNIFRTLSDILSRNSYIMPFTRPYSLWNMRNYMYLWILLMNFEKLQRRLKEICPSSMQYFKRYKQEKMTFQKRLG